MIWHEFQNIEKLEADEAHEASKTATVPSLNEFLVTTGLLKYRDETGHMDWRYFGLVLGNLGVEYNC